MHIAKCYPIHQISEYNILHWIQNTCSLCESSVVMVAVIHVYSPVQIHTTLFARHASVSRLTCVVYVPCLWIGFRSLNDGSYCLCEEDVLVLSPPAMSLMPMFVYPFRVGQLANDFTRSFRQANRQLTALSRPQPGDAVLCLNNPSVTRATSWWEPESSQPVCDHG
jgi:hypothetical protein